MRWRAEPVTTTVWSLLLTRTSAHAMTIDDNTSATDSANPALNNCPCLSLFISDTSFKEPFLTGSSNQAAHRPQSTVSDLKAGSLGPISSDPYAAMDRSKVYAETDYLLIHGNARLS